MRRRAAPDRGQDRGTAARPASQSRGLAGRIPPLLRDRGFRRYWSGQTISMFGDQISAIVLPLVGVIALRAGPAQMGYLAALQWLPSLLFGLHAGAWVDRRGRRRATMIAADLGRAALLGSVPVCYALDVLTLGQLYGVAFGVGLLSTLFTVSDPAQLLTAPFAVIADALSFLGSAFFLSRIKPAEPPAEGAARER